MTRSICALVVFLFLAGSAPAAQVTVNPGDTPINVTYSLYQGSTYAATGPTTTSALNLAAGTYTVKVGMSGYSPGSFTVDSLGNTTVLDGAPGLLGGAGTLKLVNAAVTVDVGNYSGKWSSFDTNIFGDRTYDIPLGTSGISLWYGSGYTPPDWGSAVQGCVWNVLANGTVSVDPTDSLRGGPAEAILPFHGGAGLLQFPPTIPLTLQAPSSLPGTLRFVNLQDSVSPGLSTYNALPGRWDLQLNGPSGSFDWESFDLPANPPSGWYANLTFTIQGTQYPMTVTPDPATLSLLAAGALCVLRRRRK